MKRGEVLDLTTGLRLRASAVFILTSLVMLQVFVMLSTSRRVFQDIEPYEVSSFVLVLRTTGDGVLCAPRQNRVCAGILPYFIRLACGAADRAKTAAFTRPDVPIPHPLDILTGREASASPCSEMVSRK